MRQTGGSDHQRKPKRQAIPGIGDKLARRQNSWSIFVCSGGEEHERIELIARDYEHLNISYIEAEGETLEELLETATIFTTNWHGGEGPQWSAGDLHIRDYEALEGEFKAFLS